MDSDDLVNRIKVLLAERQATPSDFAEPRLDISDDSDELITTVLDPDEFDKILREVSGNEGFLDTETEHSAYKGEDNVDFFEHERDVPVFIKDVNFGPANQNQKDAVDKAPLDEDCYLVDFDPFFPKTLDEAASNSSNHVAPSADRGSGSPDDSPTDDKINRLRYSREDFVVLHCNAPLDEPCFKTLVRPLDFNKALAPWKCSRHKEKSRNKRTGESKEREPIIISDTEINDNTPVSWKPAEFLTKLCVPVNAPTSKALNKRPALATSIWKDGNVRSYLSSSQWRQPSVSSGFLDHSNMEDCSYKQPASDSSSGAQPDGLTKDPTLPAIQKSVIEPHNFIPNVILERESSGYIFVYTTAETFTTVENQWQYYKIGCQMDIKRQNQRLLQKCPIVRQIRDRFHEVEFRSLKRFYVSKPNLLKYYINHELSQNYFNAGFPMTDWCNWCNGSHRDWYYLTTKGAKLLDKKHIIPNASPLPGWAYINTMICQLVRFIEKTDFS